LRAEAIAHFAPEARTLLLGRALRAFVDGYVAILLPVYLLTLGFGAWEVGLLSTATLLGFSAGHAGGRYMGASRFPSPPPAARRRIADGRVPDSAFANLSPSGHCCWSPSSVRSIPSSGDVSVFLPLEHARLSHAAEGDARTRLFARYSVHQERTLRRAGCAGRRRCRTALVTLGIRTADRRCVCHVRHLCGITGLSVWMALFSRLESQPAHEQLQCTCATGTFARQSSSGLQRCFRSTAFRRRADTEFVAVALAVRALRRSQSTTAGAFFFWAGLLTAASQLAGAQGARKKSACSIPWCSPTSRPASVLILAALAPRSLARALGLLLLRALRCRKWTYRPASAYRHVGSNATRNERRGRQFYGCAAQPGSSIKPVAGRRACSRPAWLAAPLVACGCLKIAYDLALWQAFRQHPVDEVITKLDSR
jgi:hypothetical protein